jgi:hypothetical protein
LTLFLNMQNSFFILSSCLSELGLCAFQYHVFLSDVRSRESKPSACNVTFHAFNALVLFLGLLVYVDLDVDVDLDV